MKFTRNIPKHERTRFKIPHFEKRSNVIIVKEENKIPWNLACKQFYRNELAKPFHGVPNGTQDQAWVLDQNPKVMLLSPTPESWPSGMLLSSNLDFGRQVVLPGQNMFHRYILARLLKDRSMLTVLVWSKVVQSFCLHILQTVIILEEASLGDGTVLYAGRGQQRCGVLWCM